MFKNFLTMPSPRILIGYMILQVLVLFAAGMNAFPDKEMIDAGMYPYYHHDSQYLIQKQQLAIFAKIWAKFAPKIDINYCNSQCLIQKKRLANLAQEINVSYPIVLESEGCGASAPITAEGEKKICIGLAKAMSSTDNNLKATLHHEEYHHDNNHEKKRRQLENGMLFVSAFVGFLGINLYVCNACSSHDLTIFMMLGSLVGTYAISKTAIGVSKFARSILAREQEIEADLACTYDSSQALATIEDFQLNLTQENMLIQQFIHKDAVPVVQNHRWAARAAEMYLNWRIKNTSYNTLYKNHPLFTRRIQELQKAIKHRASGEIKKRPVKARNLSLCANNALT